MIHSAIMGSIERFFAVLLEHTAGVLPVWLSPMQVRVLPISVVHTGYAQEVLEMLKAANIRADVADANESLSKKIREAKLQKIPYLIVVGDAEVTAKTVSIESRDNGKLDITLLTDFIASANEEIKARK